MNHTTGNGAIRLPRWYARLSATNGSPPPLGANDRSTVSVGRLTVFHADQGCGIATFGSPDRLSAVVFDGYLFDRDELAAELGICPQRSREADLIAAAYQRWGTALFDKLDGCYLIAIWDAVEDQLLIAHDSLGRHPAYYSSQPDAIWFASNVLALSSSGAIANHPNRLSLALAMLVYWPEAGQTFFEQIRRVLPGHYLQVSARHVITEHRHFRVIPDDDEPWLTEDEVIEGFEPALIRAVARCMQLAPQGIMLSGGVDSVTVAALATDYARAHGGPPIVAVSGRSGRELIYEERMQSAVAEALQMRHLVSTTREWTKGRDNVSVSLDVTRELPAPSLIPWVGTYMSFYRRTASQQVTTLLTGSGGDNWLGVADVYGADLLRRLQLRRLVQTIKADIATGGGSLRGSARSRLWTWGLLPHLDTLWARATPARKLRYHRTKWEQRLPPWLSPDPPLRDELVEHLLGRRMPSVTESGRAPSSYYRHSLRTIKSAYMHYEYEVARHIETLCGLRLLSPYHDKRLVTFFNRIAPSVLMHGTRYKGLLRPVVAKRLPALGLENQRKEYSPDSTDFKLRELRRAVAVAFQGADFASLGRLGVIDSARAEREIDNIDAHGFERLSPMFIMMSAESWVGLHTSA
jgi:asparagine synthetase B (glutamine-hydrolysing)